METKSTLWWSRSAETVETRLALFTSSVVPGIGIFQADFAVETLSAHGLVCKQYRVPSASYRPFAITSCLVWPFKDFLKLSGHIRQKVPAPCSFFGLPFEQALSFTIHASPGAIQNLLDLYIFFSCYVLRCPSAQSPEGFHHPVMMSFFQAE